MSIFVSDIEKTEVTDFKKASSPQEVVSYLSSGERLKKAAHLYHYTKLSSMIDIIKSGYWVMRSPKYMNDVFEFENWSPYNWSGVFFASFMGEQKENIGMWSMYAQPWTDGVKIAIGRTAFKNWIKNINTVYKADPRTYEVDEYTIFEIGKRATIKCNAVAYSNFDGTDNGKNESIRCGQAVNEQLRKGTGNPLLAGYIKNDAWDYEREIRLRVDLDKSIDCEAVAIKVPSELINAMTIVKGPRFNGNLCERIQAELGRGLLTDESLFFGKIKEVYCDKCAGENSINNN